MRVKASAEPTVKEARVLGTVVFEFPPENTGVKLLGPRQVLGRQLNIVDLVVRFGLTHALVMVGVRRAFRIV